MRGTWTTSIPTPTITRPSLPPSLPSLPAPSTRRVPDPVENRPLPRLGVRDRYPLPVPPAPGLDVHGHAGDTLGEGLDPHGGALHDAGEAGLAVPRAALEPARLDHAVGGAPGRIVAHRLHGRVPHARVGHVGHHHPHRPGLRSPGEPQQQRPGQHGHPPLHHDTSGFTRPGNPSARARSLPDGVDDRHAPPPPAAAQDFPGRLGIADEGPGCQRVEIPEHGAHRRRDDAVASVGVHEPTVRRVSEDADRVAHLVDDRALALRPAEDRLDDADVGRGDLPGGLEGHRGGAADVGAGAEPERDVGPRRAADEGERDAAPGRPGPLGNLVLLRDAVGEDPDRHVRPPDGPAVVEPGVELDQELEILARRRRCALAPAPAAAGPDRNQAAHRGHQDQRRPPLGPHEALPISARITAAISWATCSIVIWSSPSTMMRASASVPEYRTRIRARPSSFFSHRPMASLTAGTLSSGGFARTGTLTSTCGNLVTPAANSVSSRPVWRRMRRSWSPESRPSPVGAWSRKMMWPDCSPPRFAPRRSISSRT